MNNKIDIIEENDQGIDILNFLQTLWKRKNLIIVLSIIFALTMFIKTEFFSVPLYQSNGILYIRTVSNEIAEEEEYIYGSDISAARDLTSTYTEILKTRSFLIQVSDEIGNKYSWSQIKGMLSISSLNDTELLSIVVTAVNPDDAFDIASAVLKKAPEKFESVLSGGDVFLVDNAAYSDVPLAKGTTTNTLLGFALGFILGVIIAFLMDLFDKKVHNSADVEKKYNVTILGEISHGVTVNRKKGKSVEHTESIENILNENSLFSTAETYKSIRTNIMFSIPKTDKGKVIVVSSSSPAEGKTTTAINMAITFAQTGAKVVLVDCDLRKPRVHRYLQLSKDNGLSNVLCGFCELENSVQKSKYDSLDVLVAGEIPSNPAELLNSEEFDVMLNKLQQKYEYIFIDTPPMTVVTDAAVIMHKSNGAVVVAREDYTTFDLLDITIDSIKKCNTKIFGVVMVGSAEKQKKYSYYRNNKYGYKNLHEYRYGDLEGK